MVDGVRVPAGAPWVTPVSGTPSDFQRRHDDDDRFLTRREAELLIATTAAAADERAETHLREHKQESEALDKALVAEARAQQQHNVAHDKAHDAHEEKHRAENVAVETALAGVDRERNIHAAAHQREHEGHQREHGLNNLAIDKAEAATDKRFYGVNGTRDQMAEVIRGFATRESVDALTADKTRRWEELRKELDRRFAEQQSLITGVREADIKAEGKGMGQAATIAAILGSVTAATAIIGLIIVIANLLTSAR